MNSSRDIFLANNLNLRIYDISRISDNWIFLFFVASSLYLWSALWGCLGPYLMITYYFLLLLNYFEIIVGRVFLVLSWCAYWSYLCLSPSFNFYSLMFCNWALSWTLFFLDYIKFYCNWYWFFSRLWIASFLSSRIFSIYL